MVCPQSHQIKVWLARSKSTPPPPPPWHPSSHKLHAWTMLKVCHRWLGSLQQRVREHDELPYQKLDFRVVHQHAPIRLPSFCLLLLRPPVVFFNSVLRQPQVSCLHGCSSPSWPPHPVVFKDIVCCGNDALHFCLNVHHPSQKFKLIVPLLGWSSGLDIPKDLSTSNAPSLIIFEHSLHPRFDNKWWSLSSRDGHVVIPLSPIMFEIAK